MPVTLSLTFPNKLHTVAHVYEMNSNTVLLIMTFAEFKIHHPTATHTRFHV